MPKHTKPVICQHCKGAGTCKCHYCQGLNPECPHCDEHFMTDCCHCGGKGHIPVKVSQELQAA